MDNVRGIRVTGGSFPARVWRAFMQQACVGGAPALAAAGEAPDATGVQPGYRVYNVCSASLKIARPDCPDTMELMLPEGCLSADICSMDH